MRPIWRSAVSAWNVGIALAVLCLIFSSIFATWCIWSLCKFPFRELFARLLILVRRGSHNWKFWTFFCASINGNYYNIANSLPCWVQYSTRALQRLVAILCDIASIQKVMQCFWKEAGKCRLSVRPLLRALTNFLKNFVNTSLALRSKRTRDQILMLH